MRKDDSKKREEEKYSKADSKTWQTSALRAFVGVRNAAVKTSKQQLLQCPPIISRSKYATAILKGTVQVRPGNGIRFNIGCNVGWTFDTRKGCTVFGDDNCA
uniref:Uncharacterized protein n=1 Tax=Glossina morsitans morsitans TaxID=37546 RepID=A0A1B0GDQ4_GLOMM